MFGHLCFILKLEEINVYIFTRFYSDIMKMSNCHIIEQNPSKEGQLLIPNFADLIKIFFFKIKIK